MKCLSNEAEGTKIRFYRCNEISYIFKKADSGSEPSHLGLAPPRDRDLGRQDLGSAGVWEGD